jgi:N-acyl-D-amino-acid deacylase
MVFAWDKLFSMFDLLIRGGTVVDGTGRPGMEADVGINGSRVAAVGRLTADDARRTIDARGKLVLPGFVDLHTHYDAQVTWDPQLTPSSWHGVTTVVMGSCGVGFAPVRASDREFLIELMEGVEDIPGAAMHEGIRWAWESYPEYMDAIEKLPRVMDVGGMLPHGALRAYVMGERGAANEPARPDEVATMRRLAVEALRAGALGVSTSRTSLHRAKDGRLMPGTIAEHDEVFALGHALKDAGHGVFQMTCEHGDLLGELDWMEELATAIGRPMSFNLSQIDQSPGLWRQVAAKLDAAAARGAPLYAQVAGRGIGILMGWGHTAHPFATRPSWAAIAGKPLEEKLAILRDPTFREKLIAEKAPSLGPFFDFITGSFQRMFVGEGEIDYEPPPSQSVAAIAQREGRRPEDVAYDALSANGGRGMLYFPLFNYADGDLAPLHELHQSPRTIMGLSDAGAHCGAICDGGMPTFMLTHWTRDRARGPRLPLEHIVKRQTLDTARFVGLFDRGVIAPGWKADLLVVDMDRLALAPPELAFDLPADGRRLLQRARGYDATVVSGTIVAEHDEPTGALPGRFLRGPQAATA